jgi:hypothetical protein
MHGNPSEPPQRLPSSPMVEVVPGRAGDWDGNRANLYANRRTAIVTAMNDMHPKIP